MTMILNIEDKLCAKNNVGNKLYSWLNYMKFFLYNIIWAIWWERTSSIYFNCLKTWSVSNSWKKQENKPNHYYDITVSVSIKLKKWQ